MLVSCDERRNGFPARGEIQQISLVSDTRISLPLVNLPAIPFHPHGFDLQNVMVLIICMSLTITETLLIQIQCYGLKFIRKV